MKAAGKMTNDGIEEYRERWTCEEAEIKENRRRGSRRPQNTDGAK